jgi:hypothetical protein
MSEDGHTKDPMTRRKSYGSITPVDSVVHAVIGVLDVTVIVALTKGVASVNQSGVQPVPQRPAQRLTNPHFLSYNIVR